MNRLKVWTIGAFTLFAGMISAQTTVSFSIENACLNENTILESTSTSSENIVDYKWDIDNDGAFDEYEGPSRVTPIFPTATTWSVGLRIYLDNGDSATAYQDVVVTNVPVAGFGIDAQCVNTDVNFTNQATLEGGSIDRIIWNYGDGTSEEMVGDVSKRYANPEMYSVTQIVISDALCADTLSQDVTVGAQPTSEIVTNGEPEIAVGQTLELEYTGNLSTVSWSTGENTATIMVTEAGTYSVNAIDANGCILSDSISVTQEDAKNSVYNVFSPNNDGVNDIWKIKQIELYDNVSVKIFDKRGNIVLDEANYQNDWNGTWDGTELPEGVYFYQVSFNEGDAIMGTITLLR
jgi:gliding motility-associated-like protein